jgi:TolA-binding protein
MNQPVDVHPEDLLDQEQRGELTRDERARLDAHVAICAACALVRRASRDFDLERLSVVGDEGLIGRITATAMSAAASAAPPPSPRRTSYIVAYPRRRRRAWAIAGALLFAATGATASFWSVRHGLVSRLLVNTPTTAPAARAETKAAPTPRAPSPPRTEVVVVEAPPAPVPVRPASPPAAPRSPRAEDIAPVSADQLFASANEARRRGDSSQAIKLYRQLQQQFLGTREETTSRVLLGRLLQDRGEDPAQSLSLFTRYLAESPNGTLAEEARLGRALALQRLGRTQDERQAWQELLSFHPSSIHAERARKRLDELR